MINSYHRFSSLPFFSSGLLSQQLAVEAKAFGEAGLTPGLPLYQSGYTLAQELLKAPANTLSRWEFERLVPDAEARNKLLQPEGPSQSAFTYHPATDTITFQS